MIEEAREARDFGGMGVCTWLLKNCWGCKKELSCRESQEIQNTLVAGRTLRPRTAEAVGLPAEPKELWHCLLFEPKRARPATTPPASAPAPSPG